MAHKMRSRRPYVVFDADKPSKPNFWQCEVNIPTELLRTFVAVFELGSFTKAAQLFDLTQPAVSAHMRKLEVMLGGDLIEKKASGINLTARGEQAMKSARRLLAINDELVVSCGTQHRLQGIRLGIPNISAEGLRKIIGVFRHETGRSRVRICCDHSIGLLESVRSGYLDLAFLFADEAEMKDAVTSWSEDLVWVRAPDLALEPGGVVPLISSPNWLVPDRRFNRGARPGETAIRNRVLRLRRIVAGGRRRRGGGMHGDAAFARAAVAGDRGQRHPTGDRLHHGRHRRARRPRYRAAAPDHRGAACHLLPQHYL